MERADRIIDLGPAAGVHGGEILAAGTPAEIKASDRSLTGLFLARGIAHPLRGTYRALAAPTRRDAWLEMTQIHFRNLKGFDLRLPLGRLGMVAATFMTTAKTPEVGTPPRPVTCRCTVAPGATAAFAAPVPFRVSNTRAGANDVNDPGAVAEPAW